MDQSKASLHPRSHSVHLINDIIVVIIANGPVVVQSANQCPVRTVHQSQPPLWKADVPGLCQKEVQYRRG